MGAVAQEPRKTPAFPESFQAGLRSFRQNTAPSVPVGVVKTLRTAPILCAGAALPAARRAPKHPPVGRRGRLLGLRGAERAVFVIGVDDLLHQFMAHDVGAG